MKRLILYTTFFLTLFISQAAKPQVENVQNSDMGEYIFARKKAIHDYYESRLTEMQFSAKEKIILLEIAEKPQSTSLGLSEWAELAEAVLEINNLESDSRNLRQTSSQSPAERLASALSKIARRKSRILANLEWETLRLEQQRRYDETEGLDKLIKKQLEREQIVEPEQTHGILAGIIYSQDDPIAIIDGQIMRKGESIHDAKLVNIYESSVLFEKNGTIWTQNVSEMQKEYWE